MWKFDLKKLIILELENVGTLFLNLPLWIEVSKLYIYLLI